MPSRRPFRGKCRYCGHEGQTSTFHVDIRSHNADQIQKLDEAAKAAAAGQSDWQPKNPSSHKVCTSHRRDLLERRSEGLRQDKAKATANISSAQAAAAAGDIHVGRVTRSQSRSQQKNQQQQEETLGCTQQQHDHSLASRGASAHHAGGSAPLLDGGLQAPGLCSQQQQHAEANPGQTEADSGNFGDAGSDTFAGMVLEEAHNSFANWKSPPRAEAAGPEFRRVTVREAAIWAAHVLQLLCELQSKMHIDLTSDNLLCEVCPWAWEVMQHISGMSIPELQQLYQPHQLPLVLLQPMLTDGLPSEGPLQSRSQRATGKATYSAPEVPSACQQSDKVDSWSLGCMALGLIMGRKWLEKNGKDPEALLSNGKAQFEPDTTTSSRSRLNVYRAAMTEFLEATLAPDPNCRWSTAQACHTELVKMGMEDVRELLQGGEVGAQRLQDLWNEILADDPERFGELPFEGAAWPEAMRQPAQSWIARLLPRQLE